MRCVKINKVVCTEYVKSVTRKILYAIRDNKKNTFEYKVSDGELRAGVYHCSLNPKALSTDEDFTVIEMGYYL
jgi:hypothetical protein